jgi:hypothetical protein
MNAAGNDRTIRDVGQSVFGIPGDTEKRLESGDSKLQIAAADRDLKLRYGRN